MSAIVQAQNDFTADSSPVVTGLPGIFENLEVIDSYFRQAVEGYHLINSSPINEATWEDINALVFSSSGIEVYSKSDGSHLPGMDINCSLGKISNKSAKYSKNRKTFDISSYHLPRWSIPRAVHRFNASVHNIHKTHHDTNRFSDQVLNAHGNPLKFYHQIKENAEYGLNCVGHECPYLVKHRSNIIDFSNKAAE